MQDPAAIQDDFVTFTAEIVSAYVSHNSVPAADLASLIASAYAALVSLGKPVAESEVVKAEPAVPIRKSISPDYIICLEDGKKFASLRRHLKKFDLTPEQYRAKWGLPRDYPMVAPNYAAKRSELAKSIGLGQRSAKAADAPKAPRKRAVKEAAA